MRSEKKFLSIFRWNNKTSSYQTAGCLVYDISASRAGVSFFYHDDYMLNSLGDLDPSELTNGPQKNVLVKEGKSPGQLHDYFHQYLPNDFLCLKLDAGNKSEFELLEEVAKINCIQGPLAFSPEEDQGDSEIDCINELRSYIKDVFENYISCDYSQGDLTKLSPLLTYNGSTPKVSYFCKKNQEAMVIKLVKEPDMIVTRNLCSKVLKLAKIDTVNTEIIEVDEHKFLSQTRYEQKVTGDKILKFNKVPFSTLLKNDEKTFNVISYSELAYIIRKYSVNVEADLKELLRRVICSCALRLNPNLSDFELMDKSINEWRLAPQFFNEPDFNNSSRLNISLAKNISTRSLCKPNDALFKRIAKSMGVEISEVESIMNDVKLACNSILPSLKVYKHVNEVRELEAYLKSFSDTDSNQKRNKSPGMNM